MNAIMSWKCGTLKNVCVHLSKFLQLLNCFEIPIVQLYAIWTLYNLYTENCLKIIIIFTFLKNQS